MTIESIIVSDHWSYIHFHGYENEYKIKWQFKDKVKRLESEHKQYTFKKLKEARQQLDGLLPYKAEEGLRYINKNCYWPFSSEKHSS